MMEGQSLVCLQTVSLMQITLPTDNQAYGYDNVTTQQTPHNVFQFLELPNGSLSILLKSLDAFKLDNDKPLVHLRKRY